MDTEATSADGQVPVAHVKAGSCKLLDGAQTPQLFVNLRGSRQARSRQIKHSVTAVTAGSAGSATALPTKAVLAGGVEDCMSACLLADPSACRPVRLWWVQAVMPPRQSMQLEDRVDKGLVTSTQAKPLSAAFSCGPMLCLWLQQSLHPPKGQTKAHMHDKRRPFSQAVACNLQWRASKAMGVGQDAKKLRHGIDNCGPVLKADTCRLQWRASRAWPWRVGRGMHDLGMKKLRHTISNFGPGSNRFQSRCMQAAMESKQSMAMEGGQGAQKLRHDINSCWHNV